MNIAFFIRHFTERGTEVSTYDYAKYNEEILYNKSYIICFTHEGQKAHFPGAMERYTYDKFKRFEIIEINHMNDMKEVIEKYNLSFFYAQTHGGNDIYQLQSNIWGKCKTIKHCVFHTTYPEGEFYISISKFLNEKYNTNLPVIPYMVDLPIEIDNLRKELNIPDDAFVFGRHGGSDQFNIKMAHDAIKEYLDQADVYFLFMNTDHFYEHPRIIYLDRNIDLQYKAKFINTCDAMIHAREMGETFGLSVGEFSIKNKPIITCKCGDLEHVKILGDKAILYQSKEELVSIFKNIKTIISSRSDWTSYDFSPAYVMSLFKAIFDTY